MEDKPIDPRELRVIAPCLGKRFSGINASMIAVLPEQAKNIPIATLGFHIDKSIPRITFGQFWRHCRDGQYRIWHARRNVDMLAGIVLKHIFRFRLILLFTSVAQRRHSWITRFYYHQMDGLIAASSRAASFLDREAVVIPHGVNTDLFHPPDDRAEAWAARGLKGRYGIGIFGRIRPQKGTEEFVEAMIRVLPSRPEWSVVLVGQTTEEYQSYERKLRAKIQKAGLDDRFHFTGFLEDSGDIPGWYRSLSVVACPSRVEGFGLPCLEAMASGCPVVATRTGYWPELITEGEDGYVVPCRDTDALTEAIMKITEDPGRVSLMGRQAREKITGRHRIQNEAEGILQVYEKLFVRFGEDVLNKRRPK
ncbi:MAG: glycosyltransferase family 4 protein [Nitrospirota bacterium]